MPKQQAKPQKSNEGEFSRFEELTRNLISVSNSELRQKMEEEKRRKKPNRRHSSTSRKSAASPK
jgi:hypothetical protein